MGGTSVRNKSEKKSKKRRKGEYVRKGGREGARDEICMKN